MSSPFTLHWSPVTAVTLPDASYAPEGYCLVALWPSPVNPDACFEEAGFRDFGDNDAVWDENAGILLQRLLPELSHWGEARLLSQPLMTVAPWYLRPFRQSRPLALVEQVELPMQWDSLPRCHVAFGDRGVALHAGDGHCLYWLTLPVGALDGFIRNVAGGWPVVSTALKWEALL
jgi:hypothetical protein